MLYIHQTWRDEQIPEVWQATQATCQRVSGSVYKLWTDSEVKQYLKDHCIETEFTFISGLRMIQMVDIWRVLLLATYGEPGDINVYIDLDVGLVQSLHTIVGLLQSSTATLLVPQTRNTLVGEGCASNFILMGKRCETALLLWHAYMHNCKTSHRWYYFNLTHFKVLHTGPFAVQALLKQYRAHIYLLPHELVNNQYVWMTPCTVAQVKSNWPNQVFFHAHGESWCSRDTSILNKSLKFGVCTKALYWLPQLVVMVILGCILIRRQICRSGNLITI